MNGIPPTPEKKRVGLPRTGQTTSYATGDDGTYQAGRVIAATRVAGVINNGNGTLTDIATGLTWVQNPAKMLIGTTALPAAVLAAVPSNLMPNYTAWANNVAYAVGDCVRIADGTGWVCKAVAAPDSWENQLAADCWHAISQAWMLTDAVADFGKQSVASWALKIAACEALVYAGYSDWRMPNPIEALTLFNFGAGSPFFYSVFPGMNAVTHQFWTSHTRQDGTIAAMVLCGNASVSYPLMYQAKTSGYAVMPVRGGRHL